MWTMYLSYYYLINPHTQQAKLIHSILTLLFDVVSQKRPILHPYKITTFLNCILLLCVTFWALLMPMDSALEVIYTTDYVNLKQEKSPETRMSSINSDIYSERLLRNAKFAGGGYHSLTCAGRQRTVHRAVLFETLHIVQPYFYCQAAAHNTLGFMGHTF